MKEIEQIGDLIDIDSTVAIDIERIQDNISIDLQQKLQINSNAKVLGYKITDGTDIGFFLELSDGSKRWFFSNEIISVNNNIVQSNKVSNKKSQFNQVIYSGNELSYVINPINFVKWLINVTSDVF